ncbi:RES domain-containing protein [Pedobacter sp. WC2423]|uniref:RES domain-containing protein n=1 Tax=Pedobacter sp. WC2423 TaxID=3234142 RepID=UPI00346709B3
MESKNNNHQHEQSSSENWLLLINKFPELIQFKEDLNELFQIDKSSMNQQEIGELFYRKALIQPFASIQYLPDHINSFPVYRARKNIDENNENIYLVKTYSYPNPEFCESNGRANLKGQSVFYSAHNAGTALMENKPVNGDILYLSKWNIRSDRPAEVMFFFPENVPEKNIFFKMSRRLHQERLIDAGINGEKKARQLEMIIEFIADAFVTEQEPYSLTSWYSNCALFEQADIDMLIYPSMQRKYVTSNIVIHPEFVDKYLVFDRVFKVIVTNRYDNNMGYKLLKTGNCIGENITWRDPVDDDYKFLENNY